MQDIDRIHELRHIEQAPRTTDMHANLVHTCADIRHWLEITRRKSRLDPHQLLSKFAPNLEWKRPQILPRTTDETNGSDELVHALVREPCVDAFKYLHTFQGTESLAAHACQTAGKALATRPHSADACRRRVRGAGAVVTQWFIAFDGQSHGPYAAADVLQRIRSGQLPPGAVFWRAGLAGWIGHQEALPELGAGT